MNELILNILGVVLTAISVPIGAYIASFIRRKIQAIKNDILRETAFAAVEAAEQTFANEKGVGSIKFKEVMADLEEEYPWAKQIQIRRAIESAVRAMKRADGSLGNATSSPSAS